MKTKNLILEGNGEQIRLGWFTGPDETIFNALANFGVSEDIQPNSTGFYSYITTSRSRLIKFFADWQQFHNRRKKKRICRAECERIAAERVFSIPVRKFTTYGAKDSASEAFSEDTQGDAGGLETSRPWDVLFYA